MEHDEHDQGKSEAHLDAIAWHSKRANEEASKGDDANPKAIAAHVEAIVNHSMELSDHLDKHDETPADGPTHDDVHAIVAAHVDAHESIDHRAPAASAAIADVGFDWAPVVLGVTVLAAAIAFAVAKSHGLV